MAKKKIRAVKDQKHNKTEFVNMPELKENDVFYVVRNKDKKSFFGLYHTHYNDEKEEECVTLFDKVELRELWNFKGISLFEFYKKFTVVNGSINDNEQFKQEILEKKPYLNYYNIYNKETAGFSDDSPEYQKMIEATRHKSFIDKITPMIKGNFVKVVQKDLLHDDPAGYYTNYKTTTSFIEIDNITLSNSDDSYPTLRINGKSIQVTTYKSSFGDVCSILKGNVYSFVDLGSIDALIFMKKRDKNNWIPFEKSSKEDCLEFIDKEVTKSVSSYLD